MIKLITILGYALIVTYLDVWIFASHERDKNKFVWLFNPIIRYRILQKFWEIGGLIGVYFLAGLNPAIGLLIAHYFLLYDRLYYLFNKQEYLLREYEATGKDVYWLKHWYSSGYWLFRPYTKFKFNSSAIIGFLFAICSAFL